VLDRVTAAITGRDPNVVSIEISPTHGTVRSSTERTAVIGNDVASTRRAALQRVLELAATRGEPVPVEATDPQSNRSDRLPQRHRRGGPRTPEVTTRSSEDCRGQRDHRRADRGVRRPAAVGGRRRCGVERRRAAVDRPQRHRRTYGGATGGQQRRRRNGKKGKKGDRNNGGDRKKAGKRADRKNGGDGRNSAKGSQGDEPQRKRD